MTFPRLMSKRLFVQLLGKAASSAIVVYALYLTAHHPDSAMYLAAECSTCVALIVAGAHQYQKRETERPSV